MNHQLILVDGMPGTGKSSLSHLLSLRLGEREVPVQWSFEEDPHPVRVFYSPREHRDASGYAEAALAAWESYRDRLLQEGGVEILDAALLQTHLRSMLIFDLDRDAMVEVIRSIGEVISPLEPAFLYLRPESVVDNFHRVTESRGEEMTRLWREAHEGYPYTHASTRSGRDAFMAFWEEYARLADRIYDEWGTTKLRQSTADADWAGRLARACQWLGVPGKAPAYSGDGVEALLGQYTAWSSKALPGFVLQDEGGGLVAQVDEPAFDPDLSPIVRFSEARLIPKSGTVWRLLGWPYEVRFYCKEQGDDAKWFAAVTRTDSEGESEVYVKQ